MGDSILARLFDEIGLDIDRGRRALVQILGERIERLRIYDRDVAEGHARNRAEAELSVKVLRAETIFKDVVAMTNIRATFENESLAGEFPVRILAELDRDRQYRLVRVEAVLRESGRSFAGGQTIVQDERVIDLPIRSEIFAPLRELAAQLLLGPPAEVAAFAIDGVVKASVAGRSMDCHVRGSFAGAKLAEPEANESH